MIGNIPSTIVVPPRRCDRRAPFIWLAHHCFAEKISQRTLDKHIQREGAHLIKQHSDLQGGEGVWENEEAVHHELREVVALLVALIAVGVDASLPNTQMDRRAQKVLDIICSGEDLGVAKRGPRLDKVAQNLSRRRNL